MAETKPVELVARDVAKQIASILEETQRQLLSIPFGPVFEPKREKPESDYMQMHWCVEHGWHKVKDP